MNQSQQEIEPTTKEALASRTGRHHDLHSISDFHKQEALVAGDCNQTDLLGQGEEKTQRKQHPRDVFNNLFHSNNMEIITEHPTYKFEK